MATRVADGRAPANRARRGRARRGGWLEGRPELVAADVEAALDLARPRRQHWITGELAYCRWRAGQLDVTHEGADPWALQMAGDWESATIAWDELESPYEAALALADGDEGAQRRALDELTRLGAKPAAAIVARRLRRARCSRESHAGHDGRRARTPAGLTRREIEVLGARRRGDAQRRDRGAARSLPANDGSPRLGDPAQARRPHTRAGPSPRPGAARSAPRPVALTPNLGIRADAPRRRLAYRREGPTRRGGSGWRRT